MKKPFASFTYAALALGLLGGCSVGGQIKAGEAAAPPPQPVAAPADKDGDTIVDAQDACPDQAGPKNDDPKKNGCPEAAPVATAEEKKVVIVGNEVQIKDKIMFDVGKATIKPESDKLLDEIADVVKNQGKDIDLIEVEGHADTQGDEKSNLKLTDERAKSVVEALVKRGIDAKKLRAKGYGQYCPLDPASSPEAFEKNRRVEFTIVKLAGKPTGGNVGCPEAVKKGIKPSPVL
ncbi:MAG: hypothetical protein NVS3B10_28560 [Polyangiales bacterium]